MAPSPSPSLPDLASLSLSAPPDDFFESWVVNNGFRRCLDITPAEEFEQLAEHMKWDEGSNAYRKRYAEFVNAWSSIASNTTHETTVRLPLPLANDPNHPDYFAFFTSATFIPDPTALLASEFDRLAQSQGWRPGSKRYRKEQARCFAAEFETHYGHKSEKLEGWQDLCREVEISPTPASITQCKKELKRTHVNIVDLIDCRRTGEYPVLQHKSKAALRRYTLKHGKIFSLKRAKQNGFLTALLIGVF
ncbi:MAG: hypothetical protein M1839_002754 [Geoglossum umbratile]|nr:MAG: hypothetical protein M1839_002754 [Geoglossum umbratile]